MSNIGDGFKNIILAGIGAMAYTGEKGKEIIDTLVEKGEITLDQGRELNEELQRKAVDTTNGLRESALEARMRMMSAEERDKFVETVSRIADEQKAAEAAQEAAEADKEEIVVEAVEVAVDEAEAPAEE